MIIQKKLKKLFLEKDEKIKNIALYYLNLCSDAKELKEQEEKFAKRRKAIEKRAASLKEYLDYNLSGANKEFTECVLTFLRKKSVYFSHRMNCDKLFIVYRRTTVNNVNDERREWHV